MTPPYAAVATPVATADDAVATEYAGILDDADVAEAAAADKLAPMASAEFLKLVKELGAPSAPLTTCQTRFYEYLRTQRTTIDREDHPRTTMAVGGACGLSTVYPNGGGGVDGDRECGEVVCDIGSHGLEARVKAAGHT